MKSLFGMALLTGPTALGANAGAAEAGFYAGADIAVVEPSVGASDGIIVMIPGPFPFPIGILPESTRAEGSATSWNMTLGYRINRHLAGELAYTNFGPVDITEAYDLRGTSATVDTASHLKGPSISILGIVQVGEGFEAFARAGYLFGSQELNLTSGPGVFRGPRIRNAEEAWLVGIGMDIELAGRWSARVEVQGLERLPSNTITGSIRHRRFAFGMTRDF